MKPYCIGTATKTKLDVEPSICEICSCVECDSYSCFALRNKNPCTCNGFEAASCNFLTKRRGKGAKNILDNDVAQAKNTKDIIQKQLLSDGVLNDHIAVLKPPSERSSITNASKDKTPDSSKIDINDDKLFNVCDNVDSTTDKLSAQVMNLPYNDYKDSLCYTKKDKNNKIVTFDILSRIKEIYKACSCKICECIPGMTAICNDSCKCKPCDCKDCVKMNKLKSTRFIEGDNDHCPCIRCDRKECKGLVKKNISGDQYCDCVSHDYVKTFNISKEVCDCKPCECVECKTLVTKSMPITVARLGEDTLHSNNNCSCSPCDCLHCTQNLPAVSNLTHEISTGISRPVNCLCDGCLSLACEASDNETCICPVDKSLMRKPFMKDMYDYDIRRANIKKSNYNMVTYSTESKHSILEAKCVDKKKAFKDYYNFVRESKEKNSVIVNKNIETFLNIIKSLFFENNNKETVSNSRSFYSERSKKLIDSITDSKRTIAKECLSYIITKKPSKYHTITDGYKKKPNYRKNINSDTESSPANDMFGLQTIKQVSKIRCVGLELEKSLKEANNRLSRIYCRPLRFLKNCNEDFLVKESTCTQLDPHKLNLDNLHYALQQAKTLTLELIKILKQYEDANHRLSVHRVKQ